MLAIVLASIESVLLLIEDAESLLHFFVVEIGGIYPGASLHLLTANLSVLSEYF